jgi:hypothetical protein
MYITNPNALQFSKTYKCGKARGEYLIKNHKLSILSIDEDGSYVFSHTDLLDKILGDLPIHIKLFCK